MLVKDLGAFYACGVPLDRIVGTCSISALIYLIMTLVPEENVYMVLSIKRKRNVLDFINQRFHQVLFRKI